MLEGLWLVHPDEAMSCFLLVGIGSVPGARTKRSLQAQGEEWGG
jgi:hypothetical protein